MLGIVLREGIEQARTLGWQLHAWCASRNMPVVIDAAVQEWFTSTGEFRQSSAPRFLSAKELTRECKIIVSLVGDGTMIGVAHFVVSPSPLLIGVNFGTLGFLTEIRPDELLPVLETVLGGSAKIGERSMLECWVEREGVAQDPFRSQALNDIVVQKAAHARLLDLDLSVDQEQVARIRADGVILSTPTGSTAYSLAAGGSIAHPSLEVALITPICPHSLTSRPLIVGSGSQIVVAVPDYDGQVFATVDGQSSFDLQSGDRVCVTQSPNRVRFVRSPSRSYFEIIQRKLNWAMPNQPD